MRRIINILLYLWYKFLTHRSPNFTFVDIIFHFIHKLPSLQYWYTFERMTRFFSLLSSFHQLSLIVFVPPPLFLKFLKYLWFNWNTLSFPTEVSSWSRITSSGGNNNSLRTGRLWGCQWWCFYVWFVFVCFFWGGCTTLKVGQEIRFGSSVIRNHCTIEKKYSTALTPGHIFGDFTDEVLAWATGAINTRP